MFVKGSQWALQHSVELLCCYEFHDDDDDDDDDNSSGVETCRTAECPSSNRVVFDCCVEICVLGPTLCTVGAG